MNRRLHRLRQRAFLHRAARRTGADRLGALGPHSLIAPPATILSPGRIHIGDHVLIHENAFFSVVESHQGRVYDPRLRIGDGTVVGHHVWFSCVGQIDVGQRVLIGHNVLIADSFHEYGDVDRPVIEQPMSAPRPVEIASGAIIGPGAAILKGARVGNGAYVTANAVVTGEVPDHSVAAGNPAEVIRRWQPEAGEWVDSPDPRWVALLSALSP